MSKDRREYSKEYKKRKLLEDPDYYARANKKTRANNPETYSKFKKDNNDKRIKSKNEYYKNKYHSDEEYRVKRKLRSQVTHALKGKIKDETTFKLLGYTVSDFLNLFGNDIKILKEQGIEYHIDHKIPLAWFDKETPINIMFNLENLQILSGQENLDKRNFYATHPGENFLKKCIQFIKKEHLTSI